MKNVTATKVKPDIFSCKIMKKGRRMKEETDLFGFFSFLGIPLVMGFAFVFLPPGNHDFCFEEGKEPQPNPTFLCFFSFLRSLPHTFCCCYSLASTASSVTESTGSEL
jgi:hypothetical protein